MILISIHAPAKGATKTAKGTLDRRKIFQSTLPRRERLYNPKWENATMKISIHAPAKGATFELLELREITDISIHAPAKGATMCGDSTVLEDVISIHAPAKGATKMEKVDGERIKISIHAPAKGATAFINIFSLAVRLFFISSHQ